MLWTDYSNNTTGKRDLLFMQLSSSTGLMPRPAWSTSWGGSPQRTFSLKVQ